MSYGGGNYGQSGYGQSNPYGRSDPYAQRPNPYSQQPPQQQQPTRQDPYGSRPDPYGQSPQSPRQDPYGQRPNPYAQSPQSPKQDPYSRPNPYGQQQSRPPQSDLYGQQQARPPQSDPYGQKPSRPAQSDPYGSQQSRPGQADPYGQRPNPYGSQQARPPQAERPQPAQANRYGDVEMGAVRPDQKYPQATQQPLYDPPPPEYTGANILDECRKINEGVDEIEKSIAKLENAQRAAINDTTTDPNSPAARQVESSNAEVMGEFRNLIDKMKKIKVKPGAGSDLNAKHIGLADRKLQNSRQHFMQVESAYQRRLRDQTERQYRTANPNATSEEIRQACEDPNMQVFTEALMHRDRRGESSKILGNVRDRHQAIQKIEKQIEELASLFNDMAQMVAEQEPMVERIEQGAVETHENVEQGNVELTGAIDKARAARRKKWICFGICVAIIVVIIAAILIWGRTTQHWFDASKSKPAQ